MEIEMETFNCPENAPWPLRSNRWGQDRSRSSSPCSTFCYYSDEEREDPELIAASALGEADKRVVHLGWLMREQKENSGEEVTEEDDYVCQRHCADGGTATEDEQQQKQKSAHSASEEDEDEEDDQEEEQEEEASVAWQRAWGEIGSEAPANSVCLKSTSGAGHNNHSNSDSNSKPASVGTSFIEHGKTARRSAVSDDSSHTYTTGRVAAEFLHNTALQLLDVGNTTAAIAAEDVFYRIFEGTTELTNSSKLARLTTTALEELHAAFLQALCVGSGATRASSVVSKLSKPVVVLVQNGSPRVSRAAAKLLACFHSQTLNVNSPFKSQCSTQCSSNQCCTPSRLKEMVEKVNFPTTVLSSSALVAAESNSLTAALCFPNGGAKKRCTGVKSTVDRVLCPKIPEYKGKLHARARDLSAKDPRVRTAAANVFREIFNGATVKTGHVASKQPQLIACALETLFHSLAQQSEENCRVACASIEECGLLELVEQLLLHANSKVYEGAHKLLEILFRDPEDKIEFLRTPLNETQSVHVSAYSPCDSILNGKSSTSGGPNPDSSVEMVIKIQAALDDLRLKLCDTNEAHKRVAKARRENEVNLAFQKRQHQLEKYSLSRKIEQLKLQLLQVTSEKNRAQEEIQLVYTSLTDILPEHMKPFLRSS